MTLGRSVSEVALLSESATIPVNGGALAAPSCRPVFGISTPMVMLCALVLIAHPAPGWTAEAVADNLIAPALEDDDGEASSSVDEEEGIWFPGLFEAELALLSDYIDRGISSTDHKPALQGSLTYSIETGIGDTAAYLGFWGSNVDFDDGDEASVELGWLFGLTGTIPNTGGGWDLGGTYYTYPGADSALNYNYVEFSASLYYSIIEPVTLTGSYYYSPNYFGDTGPAHYIHAALSWEIPIDPVSVVLSAGTGYQWIANNIRAGVKDYQDWSAELAVNISPISVGVRYTSNNISRSGCFDGARSCDTRVVFGLTAVF